MAGSGFSQAPHGSGVLGTKQVFTSSCAHDEQVVFIHCKTGTHGECGEVEFDLLSGEMTIISLLQERSTQA